MAQAVRETLLCFHSRSASSPAIPAPAPPPARAAKFLPPARSWPDPATHQSCTKFAGDRGTPCSSPPHGIPRRAMLLPSRRPRSGRFKRLRQFRARPRRRVPAVRRRTAASRVRRAGAAAASAAAHGGRNPERLYVVLESDRGLVLLDQHAAHERILFEQMLNNTEQQGQAASQRLLLPETVELSVRDAHFFAGTIAIPDATGRGFERIWRTHVFARRCCRLS